jgi:hypothetical protein
MKVYKSEAEIRREVINELDAAIHLIAKQASESDATPQELLTSVFIELGRTIGKAKKSIVEDE